MATLIVAPSKDNPVLAKLTALLRGRRRFGDLVAVPPERAEAGFRKVGGHVFFVLAADRVADGLRAIGQLSAAGARVLVVGPATDPKLILAAMQAGGDRFLNQDELEADLDAVAARLFPRPEAAQGELIAVLSAAGGCGASTVAVNLSVLLAGEHGRCNLIDLNLQQAHLAALLDLNPQYTLADLCQHEDRLDRSLYEKVLTPHSSGMALLAGPRQFGEAEALTTGGVTQAVALARQAFAHVVVDLEDHFHDEQQAVLAQATRILLVARLDFPAIRNARRVIDQLVGRGVPRERIEVVMNLTGRPNDLAVGDAELALGGKITHLIPYDHAVVGATTNSGTPAAVSAPRSCVVRSIARLVGLDAHKSSGPGLLSRVATLPGKMILPALHSLRDTLSSLTPLPKPARPKVHHEPVFASQSAVAARACAV